MRTIRLLPFIYSSSIAYLIEIGDEYMRFFYDNEEIAVMETPYAEEHIFQLHFQQIADVMRIVHPSYAPRKLSRTSAETFELEIIDFRRGPFLTRNDLLDPDNPSTVTLASSVTAAAATGTLTASSGVFLPGHVGALFK
ncbi:MAG: hypothetical protein PHE26_12640, partial [Syntrophomonadaceae bacterium]|nr:hypothetical protein [Syntrophomonadaceae bacterium]